MGELSLEILEEAIRLVTSNPSMAIVINEHISAEKSFMMPNLKGTSLISLFGDKRPCDTYDYDYLFFMSGITYDSHRLSFKNIPAYKGFENGKPLKLSLK